MKITKEALQLFIKSLPSDNTYFQIISFGSNYHFIGDEKDPLVYNQENLEKATQKIDNFSANMGGTNLLDPFKEALKMQPPKAFTKQSYKKMIFMLTDGETMNAD